MDKVDLTIIDKTTGEIIPVNKRASDLKEYVKSLPENKKSDLLTKANWLARLANSIEKSIKDYVKDLGLEFDDDGKAMWQDHKLSTVQRYGFDADRFEKEGTEIEKKIMEKAKIIQNKYQKCSSYIRF